MRRIIINKPSDLDALVWGILNHHLTGEVKTKLWADLWVDFASLRDQLGPHHRNEIENLINER